MGVPANTLPKKLREQLGIKLDAEGRARPPLGDPLVGHVLLELAINPPKVTHHAKRIGLRNGKPALVDLPALSAARKLYETAVGIRPGPCLVPIARPVVLRVTWSFPAEASESGKWFDDVPDLDNACKLLKDVLAGAGYLANDCHVCLSVLAKRTDRVPGVRVYLRTLLSPNDHGLELPISAGIRNGHLSPIDPLQALAVTGQWEEALGEWPLGPRGRSDPRPTTHDPRPTTHDPRPTHGGAE